MQERKDGTLIPISLSVSPAKSAAGTIIGLSKIVRDFRPDGDGRGADHFGRALADGGSVGAQRSGHDAHLVRPARPDRLAAMLATRPREPDSGP